MSTEAPYIGSKISLISKAEIRYEGVLYAVDTKEATVTLAKGEQTDRPALATDNFPLEALGLWSLYALGPYKHSCMHSLSVSKYSRSILVFILV